MGFLQKYLEKPDHPLVRAVLDILDIGGDGFISW
jgi:hypothetical protein